MQRKALKSRFRIKLLKLEVNHNPVILKVMKQSLSKVTLVKTSKRKSKKTTQMILIPIQTLLKALKNRKLPQTKQTNLF